MISRALLFSLLVATSVEGFVYQSTPFQTRRMNLSMKKGRRSFKKEIDGGGNGMSSGKSRGTSSAINWCPVPAGQKLPDEEGTVGLIDTELPTMKVSGTNPTGAVGVAKYQDQTFCFASSCPSCKIPMTKANLLPGNDETSGSPRISCGFCKSTYSLKDGSKVQAAESGGLFGGVVKSLFASQDSGALKMYKLGERNGKLVIAVD